MKVAAALSALALAHSALAIAEYYQCGGYEGITGECDAGLDNNDHNDHFQDYHDHHDLADYFQDYHQHVVDYFQDLDHYVQDIDDF
ncbi:hypothetical protein FS837_012217 [Tulasnella sp. UAMH 9824]|nr:hypothetical protein FS837_012217 [Tulasnella sp. UAMH 9824]